MDSLVTPAVAIRAMTRDDLDAVVAIDAAAGGRPRRAYFVRRLEIALRHPDEHVQLSGIVDQTLVGYILARRTMGEFGRPMAALRLEAVGVATEWQHHGVAKALMDALIHYAQRHGLEELRTAADWRNHSMLHWLDAVGFTLAPNQVIGCAVVSGFAQARSDALDLPAGTATGSEINYGNSADNDYERVAAVLPEVRAMQSADLPQIVRIDRALTGRYREAYIAAKLHEAMHESQMRVSLAARLDGAIVGYLMARSDLGDFGRSEPVAVLDTIGVDPEYAHHGVGHALVSQLFANLGALHVERVETVVDPVNELGLLGFLYSIGFTPSQRLAFVRSVG